MAGRLSRMLKATGRGRSELVFPDLPYTVAQMRAHIEALFEPWMRWENHGDWEVDHKKPRSLFDHTDKTQIVECWALENLRPISAIENLKKGSKYEPN